MSRPARRTSFIVRRVVALGIVAVVALVGVAAATHAFRRGSIRSPHGVAGSGTDPMSSMSMGTLSAASSASASSSSAGRLVVRRIGRLAAPVQDAASAGQGGVVFAAGGLDAADMSTTTVRRIDAAGSVSNAGALPVALHDAAAATVDGSVYLFGGGDGIHQHGEIRRLSPGPVQTVARLPLPASDVSAASVGSTAYIVGGFDGQHALDTVVAWAPGKRARVIAHLPSPLRYAAVAAVGRTLVVAGGSRPDGTATSAVLTVDTRSGAVHVIGRLPAGTTHAGAAALGGVVEVVGGRGPTPGTPTRRIVEVDPASRTIRTVARLPVALSDVGVAAAGSRVLVVGGHGRSGTSAAVLALSRAAAPTTAKVSAPPPSPTPGANVYRYAAAGDLAPEARLALPRIYVPNSGSNTVSVIDPATYRVVDRFAVGAQPQHVTPSWDLKTLWVDNDLGNSLTPINPRTGKPGRPVPVQDPYNLYFTPDGKSAIVVAEAQRRLDFRDPHTMKLQDSLPVPCRGVDHMDFSVDGKFSLASCEFSGTLIVVDLVHHTVVDRIQLPKAGAMPQDVKLSPDGATYYVADMASNGVWLIDAQSFAIEGFLPTGRGAHGLYPSRDARYLYVSNRSAGSISVVSFTTRRVVRTWQLPGHATPDMGGVSADGRTLWLSGRYSAEVYAINTRTGRLRARIPVGKGPHGLCVWPQPGRYSLGHTGILR